MLDLFNLSEAEGDFICDRICEIMQWPAVCKAELTAQLAGLSVADLWACSGSWPYHAPHGAPLAQ